MALPQPTTQELFDQFLSNFESQLNQDAPANEKSYMRVESKVHAGVAKGQYIYAADRALQNLAITASGDGLDTIGAEYDVTRDPAEAAQYEIELPGTNGVVVPAGTDFIGDSNGERYFSDAAATTAGGVAVINVTAENVGDAGNLVVGTDTMSIGSQISGMESQADITAELNIGLDEETDESYRPRILTVIRATRGGGNATDYKIWAEAVAGVERAFPISGKPIEVLESSGITWDVRESAADLQWQSVCYGNGLFVAVSNTGTGNRVMTSPDGITWTSRTSAADNNWTGICYSEKLELFVAVSGGNAGNNVMTSSDGVNWTLRSTPDAASNSTWTSVIYSEEVSLFVAVASSSAGANQRVMTSPDGITWTLRSEAATVEWREVTYGNGLFVAVSTSGLISEKVMTSPDGINWTSRTASANLEWNSVAYSSLIGLFAAVARTGTGNRVMTSPDGITWTSRTSAADNSWTSIINGTGGEGLFVAVSQTGTLDRIMTSSDGITWTSRSNVVDNDFREVTYGNGLFVAVSETGTDDRVITSGRISYPPDRTVYIEAETSVDPDGIAPQSLLDDVRDEINYDPDTGRSRPPLGLTNSTLYVESIYRTAFYVQIEGINVDSDLLADAQSDISDALDLYFAEIAPFIDGVDVVNERNDTITDLTLSDIVQDVLQSYGGSAKTVSFDLSGTNYNQGTYTLEPGELAETGGISYA
jgi:hypothetical protein